MTFSPHNKTEASEEVGEKVQLDSETESVSDGMCLILNVLVCITHAVCIVMHCSIVSQLRISRFMNRWERSCNLILTETHPWGLVYSQVKRALYYLR